METPINMDVPFSNTVDYAQKWRAKSIPRSPDSSEILLNAGLAASNNYWKNLVIRNGEVLSEEVKKTLIERFEKMSGYSDWGIEDVPVTEKSAQTCIELLKQINPKIAPKIGCDYGGNVIVYWGNSEVYASFTCKEKKTIIWFGSYNNGKDRIRIGGNEQLSVVIEALNNHEMIQNIFVGG